MTRIRDGKRRTANVMPIHGAEEALNMLLLQGQ